MKKEEFIKRYGEDKYQEYKKKQAERTKKWRAQNRYKSRKYGREYYWRIKDEKIGK